MERKNLDEALKVLKKAKEESEDGKLVWAIGYLEKVVEDVTVYLDEQVFSFELDVNPLFTDPERNLDHLEIVRSRAYDKGRDDGMLKMLRSINEKINPEIISAEWKFEKK